MGQISRAPRRARGRTPGRDRAQRAERRGIVTPPKSASLLAACSLARPQAGGCAWCGEPLPPRRRTWCSTRCNDAFWNNHWWSRARAAAKRRDKYRCSRCGHKPAPRTRRARAGWAENHLEVNHRRPALGAHGTLSCVHHLENLETLCVACHKATTAAMRPGRDARERGVAEGG